MWPSIKHWQSWLMDELVTPRRLTTQSQAIYYRSELAGLVIENQPVPWCAESVIVEALLRLPPQARTRNDFSIQWPGIEPITAESIRSEEGSPRHRLFFRLPVPPVSETAELRWKRHVLGKVDIPVVSKEAFLTDLRLRLPTAFVSLQGRSIAAKSFVANQQQGLSASGILTSSTGLCPLIELGLTATFHNTKSDDCHTQDIPLAASQLVNREAIVHAMPPKLPRKSGEWSVAWHCGKRELAVTRLNSITPKELFESLRICDTRMMIFDDEGRFRVVKALPSEGVVRAGPCFLLASRIVGLAAEVKLEVSLRVSGTGKSIPVFEQVCLVSDGPTPFAPGMLDIEELRNATSFELRIRNTLIGTMNMSAFPMAHLNGEGGFRSAPEFSWSTAADEELAERLEKLMGGK